jgi:membrane protease YdiL (CAAX protease family)
VIERGTRDPLAALRAIGVALATTVVAAVLSYALPEAHAATGVGACFLLAVYLLVLRAPDATTIREHGLALGGVFEPEPLEPRRLLRATLGALIWALGLALLIFPPFWAGYVYWYAPRAGFVPAAPPAFQTEVLGQLLGIAFPEEAFYRGYLQTALDRAWPPTRRILGAELGAGVVVTSLLFALGHYLTEPNPGRLAVFFPSLVFGYLRARTGGIGAAIAFHTLCNLFATYLGRSYGLFR